MPFQQHLLNTNPVVNADCIIYVKKKLLFAYLQWNTTLIASMKLTSQNSINSISSIQPFLSSIVRSSFVLQVATVIGWNKSRDLFQPISVAACKNKWRSNYKSKGSINRSRVFPFSLIASKYAMVNSLTIKRFR